MRPVIAIVLALALLATACDQGGQDEDGTQQAIQYLDELEADFGDVVVEDLDGIPEATGLVLDAVVGVPFNPYILALGEVARLTAASAACLIEDGHLAVRAYRDRRYSYSIGILVVLDKDSLADSDVQFCVVRGFLTRLPRHKRTSNETAGIVLVASQTNDDKPALDPCVGARRDENMMIAWLGSTDAMCEDLDMGDEARPPVKRRDLRSGDRGPDVYDFQQRLKSTGAEIEPDGIFTPQTQTAVLEFQEAQGLEPDGVVDSDTQLQLYEEAVGNAELPTDVDDVGRLTVGSQGDNVFLVQQTLMELDYDVDATGIFDEQTREALRDFQLTNGLDGKGKVDGATLEELNTTVDDGSIDGPSESTDDPSDPASAGRPILRIGAEGQDVLNLQQRLLTLGYPIEATGVFDEATDEAVRQFQASNGLQVDGIVGENTYQALDASLEP